MIPTYLRSGDKMMRLNNWIRILGAGLILLSVPADAAEKTPVIPCAGEKTPSFPGAEGFGAYKQGGRGGSILFVTNLLDYNPEKDPPVAGSLRAACEVRGRSIILFRISGIIALKSPLAITEPFVT